MKLKQDRSSGNGLVKYVSPVKTVTTKLMTKMNARSLTREESFLQAMS